MPVGIGVIVGDIGTVCVPNCGQANSLSLMWNQYRNYLSGVGWDTDPSEYRVVLLDPRTCAQQLLRRIYARMPAAPPPIDTNARDAEIYQRYTSGESTSALAKVYGLSVQRIRKIIRHKRAQT